jgi:hypothetical protein
MPIGQNHEARSRYIAAVALRDAEPALNFTQMASRLGYLRASNARHAWIQGLRLLGRDSEVPSPRQRTISVHTGRTTHSITIDDLDAFTTKHNFTFGIEIECVGLTTHRAQSALIAAGVRCENYGYDHQTRPEWKVTTDSSLNSRNGSAEVVSPVLQHNDGLNEVRSVMKILRDAGARVNSSCGMHVHFGADTLNDAQIALIVEAHTWFQPAFDAFVLERRIDNSGFCRHRTAHEALGTAQALRYEGRRDALRNEDRSDRYKALNLQSLLRHGTIENRQHHGSLNGLNATAWIAFNQAFFQAAVDGVLVAALPMADTRTQPERAFSSQNGYEQWLEDNVDEENHWQHKVTMWEGNIWSRKLTVALRAVFGDEAVDVQHPSLDDHHLRGCNLQRSAQKMAAHLLVGILRDHNYITEELATYMFERATNIPTRTV